MRGEALARVIGNGDAMVGQLLLVQQVLQLPPADATGGKDRQSVAAQALHHTRHIDTSPAGVDQGGAAAQLVRGLHARGGGEYIHRGVHGDCQDAGHGTNSRRLHRGAFDMTQAQRRAICTRTRDSLYKGLHERTKP